MADAKPLAPFTPGPLHVTREVDSEGECQHSIRASNGAPLAVLSNYNAHEQKANAALYAAAPDVLAALQHAVHWFDQLKPEDITRYRAAIAKATGSTS